MAVSTQTNQPVVATSGHLTLTFIGGGYGESILLDVGGSILGVIDCCTPLFQRDRRFRRSNFLVDALARSPQARIAFVLLTHPHHDHYQGLAELLQTYSERVDRVVLFEGVTRTQLLRVLREDAEAKLCSRTALAAFAHYEEVLRVWEQEIPAEAKIRAADGTLIYEAAVAVRGRKNHIPLRIRALSPSPDDVDEFLGQTKVLSTLEGEGTRNPQNCNIVSVVLVVDFGETRVVLGADAHSRGWRQILSKNPDGALACDVFKVSHHGSREGNDFRLEGLARPSSGATCAVVVPFVRERLPDQGVMNALRSAFDCVALSASDPVDMRPASRVARAELPFVQNLRALPRFRSCAWQVTLDHTCRIIEQKPL